MSNLTPANELKNTLTKMSDQFKLALPSHIKPEKFVRTLQTAVGTTPALVQANRQTLFSSCMKAAQDGLLPDGREAALVTFKSKNGDVNAQYMPMVAGILKKVRNSGELASLTSEIVYANDEFKYWVDENGAHLRHVPNLFATRGVKIAVYALARTKDGSVYIEILTQEQVNAIKGASKASKYGPWSGPFADEMWKKSAIKRLAKRLPSSSDLDHTINADNEMYNLDEPVEATEKDVSPTAESLADKMETVENTSDVIDVGEPPQLNEEELPI